MKKIVRKNKLGVKVEQIRGLNAFEQSLLEAVVGGATVSYNCTRYTYACTAYTQTCTA